MFTVQQLFPSSQNHSQTFKYLISYNIAHTFPLAYYNAYKILPFLLAGNRSSVRILLRGASGSGRLLLLLLAVLYVLLLLLLLLGLGLRSIAVRRALLHRHGVLHVHLLLWGLLQLLVGRIRRGISGRIHCILRLLVISRWCTVCLLLWLMLLLVLVRHLTLLLGLLGHAGGGRGI